MLWTHNGIPVLQKKDVIFLLSDRNHTLTIGNATECDSGIYTCFAISDDGSVLAEQSITVKVLLGMKIACLIMTYPYNRVYVYFYNLYIGLLLYGYLLPCCLNPASLKQNKLTYTYCTCVYCSQKIPFL